MSWRERDYASDDGPLRRYGRPGGDLGGVRPRLDNPMSWSLPLGRVAGIDVRVHVILIIFIVVELLRAGFPREAGGLGLGPVAAALGFLFVIVLAHEFGHCAACRLVGGEADEILMWPLGGLAFCRPPRAWSAHLATAVGGPMVNVALFLVLAPILFLATARLSAAMPDPFGSAVPAEVWDRWPVLALYLAQWMNLVLLLFNLLPIFPLDGGRIAQALLWRRMGYARSMWVAVYTGYFGALALGIVGIVINAVPLVMIAIFGGLTCFVTSRQLQFTDEFLGFEEAGGRPSHAPAEGRAARSARQQRRAERRARALREEARRLDAVLTKVFQEGLQSLSASERRLLRRATRRKQQESPRPPE